MSRPFRQCRDKGGPVRRAPRWGHPGARAAVTCSTTPGYWPAVGTTSTSTRCNPDSADATGLIAGHLPGVGLAVTCPRDQVWLSRKPDTVALVIPALLAAEVSAILSRRCPPPVVVYPEAPSAGSCSQGSAMGWRGLGHPGVHRVTGVVLLSPTVTPCGPVSWVNPPPPPHRGCVGKLMRSRRYACATRLPTGGLSPGGDPPA
jgi:hypothetical protein